MRSTNIRLGNDNVRIEESDNGYFNIRGQSEDGRQVLHTVPKETDDSHEIEIKSRLEKHFETSKKKALKEVDSFLGKNDQES